MHDSTAIQHGRRSPLQISHGCIFQDAFPFLVGRLYEDGRLVLDLYEALVAEASAENGLWSCDAPHYQRTYLQYAAPRHRGRIVQHHREVLKATDKLGGLPPASTTRSRSRCPATWAPRSSPTGDPRSALSRVLGCA